MNLNNQEVPSLLKRRLRLKSSEITIRPFLYLVPSVENKTRPKMTAKTKVHGCTHVLFNREWPKPVHEIRERE